MTTFLEFSADDTESESFAIGVMQYCDIREREQLTSLLLCNLLMRLLIAVLRAIDRYARTSRSGRSRPLPGNAVSRPWRGFFSLFRPGNQSIPAASFTIAQMF